MELSETQDLSILPIVVKLLDLLQEEKGHREWRELQGLKWPISKIIILTLNLNFQGSIADKEWGTTQRTKIKLTMLDLLQELIGKTYTLEVRPNLIAIVMELRKVFQELELLLK